MTTTMKKPHSHLELTLATAAAAERELLRALLRVDLGARIHIDMKRRNVRIEGLFWGDDVVSAIEAVGCQVDAVQERPHTVVRPSGHAQGLSQRRQAGH